ncbi:hypothetical protein BV25DRAFT_1918253 [Artomyces pyxidatus]|uniref:Uncharacterized protein n=1 Tax=Artomyces pyxidatus TaxID=48021 RepID=A0ACB8STH5_9AGAM|nr:hypothetical protein BV25DRAFT_1918253 [Artomyces pyxidatus]
MPRLRKIELIHKRLAIAGLLIRVSTSVPLQLRVHCIAPSPIEPLGPIEAGRNSDHSVVPDHLVYVAEMVTIDGVGALPEDFVLPCTAPLLETAVLVFGVPHMSSFIRNSTWNTTTLTDNLFGKAVPKLRKLTLHGFAFGWESVPIANLTHLKISTPWKSLSYPLPPYNCLLDYLKSTPNLQLLHIEECLPSRSFVSKPQPIDRRMHVLPPPTAKLNLTCHGNDDILDEFLALLTPRLADHFMMNTPAHRTIRSLRMSADYDYSRHGRIMFVVRGSVVVSDRLHIDDECDIILRLPGDNAETTRTSIPSSVATFLQQSFSSHLETLHILGDLNMGQANWRLFLSRCRAMRRIEYELLFRGRRLAVREIFEVLTPAATAEEPASLRIDSGDDSDLDTIICPHLTRVVLRSVQNLGTIEAMGTNEVLSVVHSAITARKDVGEVLSSFEFYFISYDKLQSQWKMRFEEVVPWVHWVALKSSYGMLSSL